MLYLRPVTAGVSKVRKSYMTKLGLLVLTFMSCYLFSPVMAASNSSGDAFLRARNYYQQRQLNELKQLADKLDSEQYLLAPYLRYWQILLNLNDAQDADFENLLQQYPDMPWSEKLKAEWLKQLAKRQQWDKFFAIYQRYSQEDSAVLCLALMGRVAQNDTMALLEAREIWQDQFDWPATCLPLFDAMQQNQVLSQEDLWKKFRSSLREQQISTARMVLSRLPAISASQQKKFERYIQSPQEILKTVSKLDTRLDKELAIYAISRMAKRDWPQTQKILGKIQASLNPEEQHYLEIRLAVAAAFRLDDAAYSMFEKLQGAANEELKLDEQALAWKARAILRVKQWDSLIACIKEMPKKMQDEAAWRYWLARAYKEKREIARANQIFIPLAKERNFYGVLAEEEMGDIIRAPLPQYSPSEAELESLANLAGVQRAIELDRLGLRWESRAEWSYLIKGMNDKQLLAAAEIASRQGWLDLAINTAEKTQQLQNDGLRYPLPYRDVVENFSRNQKLDTAWVYGLSRQESRFNLNARSGVGASGMMQVMPETAKWIAKRNGWKDVKADNLHQLDTNVKLGTYYLRYTLDSFNGQTPMATAAYNAGPSRVRAWATLQPMEGEIYAETIPILETRLYVQKVMLNTYFYAQRLGKQGPSLKQLLGKVSNSRDWQEQNKQIENMME